MLSPQPSSNPSLSLAQPLRSERSGRDTPASVDSIPLEWDHDYDLSRDLESAVSRTLPSEDEEGQEDKDFYLRGAVGLSGRKEFFLYASLKENKREWILYWKQVSSTEYFFFLLPLGEIVQKGTIGYSCDYQIPNLAWPLIYPLYTYVLTM